MNYSILLKKIPNVVYLFSGLIVLFSFISPNFFSVMNLSNLLLQGSVLLIVSLGLTLVMLSNGIDLSVGSLMSLCGMVAGISLSRGLGLIPALFFGILVGLASGLFEQLYRFFNFVIARERLEDGEGCPDKRIGQPFHSPCLDVILQQDFVGGIDTTT